MLRIAQCAPTGPSPEQQHDLYKNLMTAFTTLVKQYSPHNKSKNIIAAEEFWVFEGIQDEAIHLPSLELYHVGDGWNIFATDAVSCLTCSVFFRAPMCS